MVFLGVYKNNRFVSKSFLRPQIKRFFAVSEYCFSRPWNAQFAYLLVGEIRFYIVVIPLVYFYSHYHCDRVDAIEEFEKVLIKRWGGTVDAVRKNLTAGEQIIARNYHQLEIYYCFFLPLDLIYKPPGCPLPGKMINVTLDIFVATSMVNHCKRASVRSQGHQGIMGFLLGNNDKEKQNFFINNFVPSKVDYRSAVTALSPSDTSIIGVYCLGDVTKEKLRETRSGVMIKLNLFGYESEEEKKMELTAMHLSTVDGDFKMIPVNLIVESRSVGGNVVMATVVSQLFPEVAQTMSYCDPLAVDYNYFEIDDDISTGDEVDMYTKRATDQLTKLAEIAEAGVQEKEKGINGTLSKEIASLRSEVERLTASMISDDGASTFCEQQVKDALLLKYVAAVTSKKLEGLMRSVKLLVPHHEDAEKKEEKIEEKPEPQVPAFKSKKSGNAWIRGSPAASFVHRK